jgi:thiol-disulfide isomerase/thioredoxin
MKVLLLFMLLPVVSIAQTKYLKYELKEQAKTYRIIGTENKTVLKTTANSHTDLSRFKGKKIIADLWYGNCGPCFRQLPFLEKMKELFANDTSIVFLNICTETTDSLWRLRIREKTITGINLLDERTRRFRRDRLLINEFNMDGWPSYVFIDETGKFQGATFVTPENLVLFAYYVSEFSKGRSLKESAESFGQEINAEKISPEFSAFLRSKLLLTDENVVFNGYRPFFKK